jgi:hypothetical protein
MSAIFKTWINELESMGLICLQCRGIMFIPYFVKIDESSKTFTCGRGEGGAQGSHIFQRLPFLTKEEKVDK